MVASVDYCKKIMENFILQRFKNFFLTKMKKILASVRRERERKRERD